MWCGGKLVRTCGVCMFTVLCVLVFCTSAHVAATTQDGYPDPRFGTDGLVKVAIPGGDNSVMFALDMQRDSQGRYWLLSDLPQSLSAYRVGLSRLLADGQPDLSFSGDGFASPNLSPLSGFSIQGVTLAFSSDGKVLVAGQYRIPNVLANRAFLCRLTVSGALDQAFGENGCARPIMGVIENGFENFYVMRVLTDGRILLIGSAQTNQNEPGHRAGFIMRLLANGQLDPDFGVGLGWILIQPPQSVQTDAYEAIGLSDGDLLIAARSLSQGMFLTRRNPDGSLDTNWADSGMRFLDVSDLHNLPNGRLAPTRLLIGTDQRISLCARLDYGQGVEQTVISAFRLHATGDLDTSFSEDGRVLTTFEDVFDVARVTDCSIDANGRMLLGLMVGDSADVISDHGLMRLLADGTPDLSLCGIGKCRLPVDLGGPGIGRDYLAAMHVQGQTVSLFATSTPNNNNILATGTRLTLLRVGPETLLADGFE